ncbi:MAG: tRNA (adenosine(37)-N6)-threonylcarbamoyltransferase complex ATPase subunit type 1 TsaE [Bacteroidales bacterium]
MKIKIAGRHHIKQAAKEFIRLTAQHRLFAFSGSMGAGKTTIIKAICEELGALNIVTSPTFTLVNEYATASGEFIYHIDFYRIKKTEEVYDFGIEEYLYSGYYCFMEWPELVSGLLPQNTVNVSINVEEDDSRTLDILLPGEAGNK